MLSKKKSIVLSEKRIQKLYNDVSVVATQHRVKIFMKYKDLKLDTLLCEMCNQIADKALESVNEKIK